jgi:hypothetical protein
VIFRNRIDEADVASHLESVYTGIGVRCAAYHIYSMQLNIISIKPVGQFNMWYMMYLAISCTP